MTSKLRSTLRALTQDLRQAGCVKLAYDESLIDQMSRGSLVSCIEWAQGTLNFLLDEEQEIDFCTLVEQKLGRPGSAGRCFDLLESGVIPPTASVEQAVSIMQRI